MSLQVWLPLNGDLQNKGLANIRIVSGTATFKNNGKTGNKCLDLHTCNRFYCQKLANKKEFSFAFWYKPETSESTVNWNDVIYFYDKNEDESVSGNLRLQTSYNNSYILSVHANTSYNMIPNSGGTYGSNTLLSSSTATRDKWYHVVITLSEDKGLNAYINGELKWIVAHNGGHITGYFNLGQIGSSGNEEGSMNDLRIFDHTLSLKEIKELSKGLVLHYPLDNNGLGKVNPNLLRYPVSNSKWTLWGYGDALREKVILEDGKTWIHVKQQDTTRYDGYFIAPDNNQIIIDNTKKYTISCLAKAGNKTNAQLIIWWHWRSTEGGANIAQNNKRIVLTSTPTRIFYTLPQYTNQTYDVNRINIMMGSYKTDNEIYFTDVKFEQGTQTTPWIPHIEDSEYSALGYDDTTIYDCSGYQNNGTANNITYSIDTPKYLSSSQFTTASTSYVKVNGNNWMAQHAKEMTINFWAYAENWTTQTSTRLFSCTQGGGFNTQAGNSGYLRFPIYVCTNEAETTYAYKFDSQELKLADLTSGWHMFTYIYQAKTGTKVYVDGNLHHTYSNVSYGIRFNINARLFLGCQANAANPQSPWFAGKESDFRLYYTILNEQDIKELYQTSALADKNSNFYTYSFYQDERKNISRKNISYFDKYIEFDSINSNIMPNSVNMGYGSANVSTGTWRSAGSNTMTRSRVLIEDSPIGKCYGFQNEGIQTPNDGSCYGIDSFPLQANTQYTISMWARIIEGTEGYAGFNIYKISSQDGGSHNGTIMKNYRVTTLNPNKEWIRCWYTFTTNSSTTRNIYIGIITGETSVTTQMCAIKIEKGLIVTPWKPKEEDENYNQYFTNRININRQKNIFSNSFIEN